MKGSRRQFSREFKVEAVRQVLENGPRDFALLHPRQTPINGGPPTPINPPSDQSSR